MEVQLASRASTEVQLKENERKERDASLLLAVCYIKQEATSGGSKRAMLTITSLLTNGGGAALTKKEMCRTVEQRCIAEWNRLAADKRWWGFPARAQFFAVNTTREEVSRKE